MAWIILRGVYRMVRYHGLIAYKQILKKQSKTITHKLPFLKWPENPFHVCSLLLLQLLRGDGRIVFSCPPVNPLSSLAPSFLSHLLVVGLRFCFEMASISAAWILPNSWSSPIPRAPDRLTHHFKVRFSALLIRFSFLAFNSTASPPILAFRRIIDRFLIR